MGHSKKQEIMTFKVDNALSEILRNMPNRSDFIRNAILSALENICPLCQGTGILTLQQRKHYDDFIQDHTIEECTHCHAHHFVCQSRIEGSSLHYKS
ncbi:CopG family transcriptional regulator [bacterium]|nr:CopG family transcriptional regulator [bacterium]